YTPLIRSMTPGPRGGDRKGRWPANIIHDGSEEVLAACPEAPGQQGVVTGYEPSSPFANVYGDMPNRAGRGSACRHRRWRMAMTAHTLSLRPAAPAPRDTPPALPRCRHG